MWSGSSIVGRSALVERQRVCLSPVGGRFARAAGKTPGAVALQWIVRSSICFWWVTREERKLLEVVGRAQCIGTTCEEAYRDNGTPMYCQGSLAGSS